MARRRSVALVVASVTMLAVGLGLVSLGIADSDRARAAFDRELYRSVSRTRELDAIALDARGSTTERAQARAVLEQVIASGPLPAEAEALAQLRACLVGPCPGELTAAFSLAKRRYADALAEADAVKRDRLADARRRLWAGFVVSGLCWVPAVFPWLGRARGIASATTTPVLAPPTELPAPPAAARAEPPEDDQTATPLEREFRLRLGALYAVQSRARENESLAAYGEVGAGLAHGLKTPLAGVRAAAQLAMQSLDPDHPASKALEDIVDSVDKLTEEIATFLRSIGTGQPRFELTPPQELVGGLIERYRDDADRRGLRFALAAADTPPILVDRGLLEMALRNLFENALQFAPRGTAIEVVVGPVEAPARAGLERTVLSSAQRAATWIEIGVIDRGAGVSPDVIAGQRPTTQRPGGSGLGLSLARRIAGRHGGVLELAAPEAGGTLARILLPAAEPG